MFSGAINLIRAFFWTCWDQGIRRAIVLTLDRFRSLARGRGQFIRHPRYPSNAFSYLPHLPYRPLISVVLPAIESPYLHETVESVLAQSYKNFELLIVDGGAKTLADFKDQRIRAIPRPAVDGTAHAHAVNAGIAAATGEYVTTLNADDLFHPDALALIVRTMNQGEPYDIFFSDEGPMDAAGKLTAWLRKGPVSMDLLLSCNPVLHLWMIRRESLERIGMMNPEFEGSHDHDLFIRACENGLRFCHVPCSIYAWRKPAPPAVDSPAYQNGKKAIHAYLARHGIKAAVTDDGHPWYRVKYELPADAGEVAVIVPFRDKPEYLQRLLSSFEKTRYPKYKLVLVNNRSEQAATKQFLAQARNNPRVEVVDFDEPFNFSRLHNQVVARIPNELLLFLNNDMEIIQPDWLEAMLEHIHRDRVAAVGCRLVRPDGSLQHAGMSFQPTILSCVCNMEKDDGFYTRVQRDISGVTAACMLIRKSVFLKVGGFDEIHFPIGFGDADLCLKIVQAGYKIIYTPFARLVHHESVSRKTQDESYEIFNLFRRFIGITPMRDRHYKSLFTT